MDALSSASNWLKGILSSNYPLVEVKSNIDGRTYKVRDMTDKQAAADLLAKTRLGLTKLCDALEKKYPDKPQIKLMLKNYRSDPARFIEATPDAQHTSYSVNKGESIHLCLRQRRGADESLVQENIMMFVGIHELAHIVTESIGHGPDFWNNMGFLLKEAEALNIYQYTDFKSHPVAYCGMEITDSPRYNPERDGTDLSIGTIRAGAGAGSMK